MMAGAGMHRLFVLIRKETRQMLRDRSNLAVGLVLPVLLILLFGYGLSFDVRNAPLAVVSADHSPAALSVLARLQGSRYLSPRWVESQPEAEQMLRNGAVDGIVRIPVDFSRRLAAGDARVQLLLNGIDTTSANTLSSYVEGAISQYARLQADRGVSLALGPGRVEITQRMWFNEAGESTWFLVPGLLGLILTLIGAFLTSLLIAREWERGTLESLFVTPVRPLELVLAKLVPYLAVGTINIVLCLLAAHFLFHVPMRGPLMAIVVASMLYLSVSLLQGLLISGITRNQFQASQVALLTSFMPAMMLSGFVFDLRNMPVAIQVIAQLLPATHFMGMIKTLFLAGNHWPSVLRDASILLLYALVFTAATRQTLHKHLRN